MASHRFDAIGTSWTIRTEESLPSSTIARLHARAEQFDATYSRFRPDSLVSQVAERPGSYRFPADAPPLFDLYRTLYRATGGTVSPLVGRALEHLGYDADYSLRRRAGNATVPAWDETLVVDGALVTATQPVMLDVGAAGKGYLVDLLAEFCSRTDSSATLSTVAVICSSGVPKRSGWAWRIRSTRHRSSASRTWRMLHCARLRPIGGNGDRDCTTSSMRRPALR